MESLGALELHGIYLGKCCYNLVKQQLLTPTVASNRSLYSDLCKKKKKEFVKQHWLDHKLRGDVGVPGLGVYIEDLLGKTQLLSPLSPKFALLTPLASNTGHLYGHYNHHCPKNSVFLQMMLSCAAWKCTWLGELGSFAYSLAATEAGKAIIWYFQLLKWKEGPISLLKGKGVLEPKKDNLMQ